jgi:phosphatidylserine/phosphatidylglycerophosphate/cardiolipin synthase-like enzyme
MPGWTERTAFEREAAVLARSASAVSEAEFLVNNLPAQVQPHFSKGGSAWRPAVAEAIKAGIRDPKDLANLIYFMQHPDRIAGGAGTRIRKEDADFVKARAEWMLYRTIATGMLSGDGRPQCSLFLSAEAGSGYTDFMAAPTTGRVTLFINGRSGTDQLSATDRVDTFTSMQAAVAATKKGDFVYLAAWQFNPGEVALTAGPAGQTWADLLLGRAKAGVKIRVIMSDFDALGAPWKSKLADIDALIARLGVNDRDNLKYIVSLHPARGLILDPTAGNKPRIASVATHHQKFLVVRSGDAGTAFCGGLDISGERTPVPSKGWLHAVWHDTHARLEGRIVRDLEREFVERWNREKAASTAPLLADWQPPETLTLSAHSSTDKSAARNPHKLQMLRTVSVGQAPADIKRDDIWQAYFRLIGCATRFLHFENQYFTEPRMADAIVRQSEAQKGLIAIFVIPILTDDPENALRDHIRALQHDFFSRLFAGMPASRRRVFGMVGRYVHAKLAVADDRALSVGSANANQRGFYLDSELNVMLDDAAAVRTFRHRLWAHDLGVAERVVAGWTVSNFLSKWDVVANRNDSLRKTPQKMSGEAVVPFDPLILKGKKTPGLPDVWGEV